jgi:hypothetical protein
MTILSVIGILIFVCGLILSFSNQIYGLSPWLVLAICVVGWLVTTVGLFGRNPKQHEWHKN